MAYEIDDNNKVYDSSGTYVGRVSKNNKAIGYRTPDGVWHNTVEETWFAFTADDSLACIDLLGPRARGEHVAGYCTGGFSQTAILVFAQRENAAQWLNEQALIHL